MGATEEPELVGACIEEAKAYIDALADKPTERRLVLLKIKRSEPHNGIKPYWQVFQLECSPNTSILEALLQIIEEQDGSLAVKYNCRGAVCGSCAMIINGKYALACNSLIKNYPKGKEIRLEPLPHYPVIRDLAVDLRPSIDKYRAIKPYISIKTSIDLSGENLQSPKDQQRIADSSADCILCGSCYSSCPMVWTNPNFLGPLALAKAHRFNVDSRESKELKEERLQIVDSENGLWRCHTAFNCTEVCPKKIKITNAIQEMKRMALRRKLRRFFLRK
ncbi:MAG: succinate dehydrogenase/fumarate reductase iron-sulfur subunit [Candidatus Hodarchaeota archaeon]